MKKYLSIFLTFAFAGALASCQKAEEGTEPGTTSDPTAVVFAYAADDDSHNPDSDLRLRIATNDKAQKVYVFYEDTLSYQSNLASMGIYIFKWKALRKALLEDHDAEKTSHDFGKDLIPKMLAEKKKLFVYRFEGYWRDVGTVKSYYDSQMDLMDDVENIDVFSGDMKVLSNSNMYPPQFIGPDANVNDSLICNGCTVYGSVKHSIIGSGAVVDAGAVVEDSIVLPNAKIGRNCVVKNAIINEGAVTDDNDTIGGDNEEITVYGRARLSI